MARVGMAMLLAMSLRLGVGFDFWIFLGIHSAEAAGHVGEDHCDSDGFGWV